MGRRGVSGRARVVGLAVAVWLVAVTGTTTLAWVVIDRAGRSIGSTPTAAASDLRPSPARPSAPSAPPSATSTTATSSGGVPTSTPAATSRSATASGPGPTGSVPVVPAPGGTSPTRRPTTRPTDEPTTRTTPPTAAAAVQRAAHVPGGEVAVRCVSGSIALRWAQPDDGWSVETGAGGPAEVEVGFRTTADGVERETQVHASCQRGAPVLEVETRGSSDG